MIDDIISARSMLTSYYTSSNMLSASMVLMLGSILLLVHWLINTWQTVKQFPPGPFPLPIIGNLHLLRKDIHLSMDRLSEKYGSVFTLWMCHIPYVVVTDIETARHVCMSKTYTDRNPMYVGGEVYTRGAKDMIMADYSPALKLHRKIAHSAIRMFGTGLSVIEHRILDTTEVLCKAFDTHREQSFDPSLDVDLACFNVMYTIVCGETAAKEDDSFSKLRNCVFMMMQSGVTLSIVNFYPFLRHLPNADLKAVQGAIAERDEILGNILDNAEKNFQDGNVTSYIQGLLQAKHDIEKEEGAGSVSDYLSRDHMEMNIFDMFLGGVETSASTIKWALMYFVKWPETQHRAQEELDKAIGVENRGNFSAVRLSHREQLPYLKASILETLRLSSVLPFGVFHKSREASVLNGYKLPKGTSTMINIWTLHHNKQYYPDPFQFRPCRFLDQDGQVLPPSKTRHFFAFSAGPRECVGQILAKAEISLYLGNVLFNFQLASSSSPEALSLHGSTKITHSPNPFKVVATRRF